MERAGKRGRNSNTNVRLNATTHFAANASISLTTPQSSLVASDLPAFCRLQLAITTNTTAGSTALAEVWLPDAWNGRSMTVGNGGFSGGIAGISTDTGHESTTLDGTWGGPHNDNAITDWGGRAFRLTVINGKDIIQRYYGQHISKSYYAGCSSGVLKEIQEFPDDFDGVIIGSPANWWTHLMGWELHMNLLVQPETSERFIPANVWTDIIAPEVLNQCDALDGLTDGIINDPRMCSFRPETLTCRPGQNRSTCLTTPQIIALRRIYSDYFEANQTYIFGSYYPGGETGFFNGLVGNTTFQIAENYFQFFALNDTNFTVFDYGPEVLRIADEINPGQANAINPDLRAFAGPSHNGKAIHYVGWADQLISPGNSLHYYETVHTFMTEHTNLNIDDFYRLFTVSGMQHWYVSAHGGSGASSFGAPNDPISAISNDPQHNVVSAIVRWVEEDIAPDNFTGVHFKNGNAAGGAQFTRPICKYPLSPHFVGGDPNSATSFICALLT
ncbi:hypothetical protein PHLGIDRAFT_26753 [Phlebiopsis gigantea 11061_1 CR5-6]|uniref:Carboxylic ester hydrolase n=1 Tax=Phlebiopsis gigantea (strain 11061_1 CR5-6) TaxID=745531 RepID=A0A0C3S2T8_PHLG1|nr:hypothetical protein PHLGIDRAFT_26753 [Phlebiopsis gigantea 11061_1 CR5-6]